VWAHPFFLRKKKENRENTHRDIGGLQKMDSAREVKVVLLGDAGVGKSCLVLRFVTGSFDKYSESTIGASFMSKLLTVDSQPIKYQIWDTAGALLSPPFINFPLFVFLY